MKSCPALVFLAAAAVSGVARAQDPESLQKAVERLTQRVDELEEHATKTSEKIGGRALLQAYTAQSLDVGGHVSSVFTYMHGENGSEAGHFVTLVELFLRAQVSEAWSVFAAPGFYVFNGGLLDNPNTTTIRGDPGSLEDDSTESRMFLSRAYAQYVAGDWLQLQGGIVGSPHGTTNREYFIPSRNIAIANLHTRYFLANQLYPQQVIGARLSGKSVIGEGQSRLEYDAYFGTQDDNPSDGMGGARLAYVFGDSGLTLAANYGRGTRQGFPVQPLSSPTPMYTGNVPVLQSPFVGRFNLGRDYEFCGIDVDWRHGEFVSKTEAYYSAERDVADQKALSTEWAWFFHERWALAYRFDYYDAGADLDPLGVSVNLLGHATEHVVGVAYLPVDAVKLRLDMHHLELPATSDTVDFVNFSWSVSF